MQNGTRKTLSKDSGQGMTEYIIVVALVAIAAIGVTTMFGGDVRGIMGAATASLAGETSVTPTVSRPTTAETGRKGLNTFSRN
jgi:Flp pilus assembly pilin Flp